MLYGAMAEIGGRIGEEVPLGSNEGTKGASGEADKAMAATDSGPAQPQQTTFFELSKEGRKQNLTAL